MRATEPTIYGMELVVAMEIDDGVPDCCGDEMDPQKASLDGDRQYVCRHCGTGVVVDDLGLVDEITYKQPA